MAVELTREEKIAEMQLKVKLLEGEMRAYDDSAQVTIRRNKEIIGHLRKTNKQLDREVADFHSATYRSTSGQLSIAMLKEESLAKTKQLNAMRYLTRVSRQRLEDLKLQYHTLKTGRGKAEEHGRKTREDDRKRRGLDNSLLQTRVKFQEAEDITRGYFNIKHDLQLEGMSFQNQLDSLEASLMEEREELCKLQVMNINALLSTEAAERELQKLEEKLSRKREERERALELCREQLREHKAQVEMTAGATLHTHRKTQQRAVFRFLKVNSGVQDVQEFVETFVAQGEREKCLEKKKQENLRILQGLNERKEHVDEEFQKLTAYTAAKRAREQSALQGPLDKLHATEQHFEESKVHLLERKKTIANVHELSQRLAEKLQHIILQDEIESQGEEETKQEEELDAEPKEEEEEEEKEEKKEGWTEFVVKLLTRCQNKLLQLREEVLYKEEQKRKNLKKVSKWVPGKREKTSSQAHITRLKKDRESRLGRS